MPQAAAKRAGSARGAGKLVFVAVYSPLDPDIREGITLSIGGYLDLVEVVEDVFQPGREDDLAQVRQSAAMASYAMVVAGRDAGEDSELGSLCRDVGESLLLIAGAQTSEQMQRLPIADLDRTRSRALELGLYRRY